MEECFKILADKLDIDLSYVAKINEVSIYADTMASQLDINDIIKAMQ